MGWDANTPNFDWVEMVQHHEKAMTPVGRGGCCSADNKGACRAGVWLEWRWSGGYLCRYLALPC
ncbi:hypothetical protein IF2G_10337 [Cordyceps javanica]|nr:hypothetical protein IF2G_10337 [Cordyceps javanica]